MALSGGVDCVCAGAEDRRTGAATLPAERKIFAIGTISAGDLRRVLRRRGGNHDDGDVERAGDERYQGDVCEQGRAGGSGEHGRSALLRYGWVGGVAGNTGDDAGGGDGWISGSKGGTAAEIFTHTDRDQRGELRDYGMVLQGEAVLMRERQVTRCCGRGLQRKDKSIAVGDLGAQRMIGTARGFLRDASE